MSGDTDLPKMTEDALRALTDQEIRQSLGYGSGELVRQRKKALEYYYGKPVGDLSPSPIEGRSSVVSTDVLDTVEWMLPALLKMFAGSDKIVDFEAKSEQFEPVAEHVTEYIGQHVFHVQNHGFNILHTWFKDALLAKVGILKVWWDIRQEESREDYVGLSDVELAILLQDKHVEPIEHNSYLDPDTQVPVHDIAVKRKADKGFCKIENVPPEEFLISRRGKSCEDAPFVAHRFQRTIGELREAKYDNVDALASDDQDGTMSVERSVRLLQNDEMPYWTGNGDASNGDPTSRVVWVTECFLKVDYDGDGVPEWRKVTRAGNHILENVECDGTPFVSICPVPIPHQFFGLSIADLAMEAQRTKTGLMRALIDNLNIAVNGRTWALEGQVNLDDLLTNRPGGVVRVKSPDAVGTLGGGGGDTASAMQMLDYVDQQKESRTGYTRLTQGGNIDALNSTATGANIVTNREDARLELVARNFAETGVRSLFLKILELVSKYQDKSERIKATKGWIDIDPREWKNQFQLKVNVGLGTGNKDQILQHLQQLGATMQMTQPMGISGPQQFYKAAVKTAETLGFNNPEDYFLDPSKNQLPPPPPDPNVMQAQAAIQISQQQFDLDRQKTLAKIQQDQLELEAKIMLQREELASKIGLQREELNHKLIVQSAVNGYQQLAASDQFGPVGPANTGQPPMGQPVPGPGAGVLPPMAP